MGETANIAGTALTAFSKIRGAQLQAGSLNSAATSLNQEAGQSVASGIQGFINERQRGSYIVSQAIARGAGFGGTSRDPSTLNVIARDQAMSDYRGMTQIYQGQDRAAEIRARAAGLESEAGATQASGWLSGMSTVLHGASGFYEKYGRQTPGNPGPAGGGSPMPTDDSSATIAGTPW